MGGGQGTLHMLTSENLHHVEFIISLLQTKMSLTQLSHNTTATVWQLKHGLVTLLHAVIVQSSPA